MGESELIKEEYLLEDKKDDIKRLKECAKYYKEKLLGKRFLIIYNEGNFVEILFKKSDFKHLTGISSDLNAEDFYNLCIGKKQNGKIIYIKPNQIYTTEKHNRALALKKLRIFEDIHLIFSEYSYILEDITTDTKSFKLGISDIKLTLLFDKYSLSNEYYTATSLRSKSYIKNAKKYFRLDFVFVKTNPYLKYRDLVFPKEIDNLYFSLHKNKLVEIIDYNHFNIM